MLRMPRQKGTETGHDGVWKVGPGKFRVRVKGKDRLGRLRQIERVIDARSAGAAARERLRLADELRGVAQAGTTVTDFARTWLDAKSSGLAPHTEAGYVVALERHILPVLGSAEYEAVRGVDVQEMVNGWRGAAPRSIRAWYAVFASMTGDAVVQLDLPRDPCKRINLPAIPKTEGNAADASTLQRILNHAQEHEPTYYAILCSLAFTGLRYCHVSGWRWEDVDWQAGKIRIARKHVRGRVGDVSRIKDAPKEVPLDPRHAEILRAHRERLMRKGHLLASGWVFPSPRPRLRGPVKPLQRVRRPLERILRALELDGLLTPHGLRRTFNDLTRLAQVEALVIRSMTGHKSEDRRADYSTVTLPEQAQAVGKVISLVDRVRTQGRTEPAAKRRPRR